MTMIQAIDTTYKGYRFRSRLEARWAVFMDNLKIKWDYEPEGYLMEGVRYLPDFLLTRDCEDGPDYLWLEVKGFEPTAIDKLKVELLCNGDERRPNGCIVHGIPVDNAPLVYHRQSQARHWGTRDAPLCSDDIYAGAWPLAVPFSDFCGRKGDGDVLDLLYDAIRAAKSARFEFDERDA